MPIWDDLKFLVYFMSTGITMLHVLNSYNFIIEDIRDSSHPSAHTLEIDRLS